MIHYKNSIKTPGLQSSLSGFLNILTDDSVKYILAGGSCITAVQKTQYIQSRFSDYDLFFENDVEFNKMETMLKKHLKTEHHPDAFFDIPEGFSTDNAVSYTIQGKDIQLIKNFKPHQQCIDDFDLCNSKYWSYPPFDTVYTNQDTDSLVNIKFSKPLDKLTFNTILRMIKYQGEKNMQFSEYYPKIFEMIKNPDDKYFNDSSYDMDPSNFGNYLYRVIIEILSLPDFQKFCKNQENKGQMLPLRLVSKSRINYLPATDILSVEYYKGERTPEIIKFITDNFPEMLL